MSVILVDLSDEQHDLQINWWNWRPILALLRGADLISDEQFERMGANGGGGQLRAEEALKAAVFLRSKVVPRLKDGEKMHVDGQVSQISDDPRLISATGSNELYAARKSFIESFAAFCETSKGFDVL